MGLEDKYTLGKSGKGIETTKACIEMESSLKRQQVRYADINGRDR